MNSNFSTANLSNLFVKRAAKSMRVSSYDKTGGNTDRLHIAPGDTVTLADIKSPGIITHIWVTIGTDGPGLEKDYLRKITLQAYWDGEKNPSIEAPVGDFFGMGHSMTKNFVSAPLQMSPQDGKGFNCFFPMPFRESAKFVVKNECENTVFFYYYIDYEEHKTMPEDVLMFHAQWRRECPTDGKKRSEFNNNAAYQLEGENKDGAGNYVLLDAEGHGHYVGANINIHNLSDSAQWDWPGEGDDMIFIDGEPWPPRLHGTGTEDYVNMAWCPTQEYSAPYHGLILGGKDNWKGKITYYRYHILDPIIFEKSIKVTIEHGHNNHRCDDWSSTAYWYQNEPHKAFAPILPLAKRLPIDEGNILWGRELI